MPNYLRLTEKDTGTVYMGEKLIAVDEKMCAALGVPVDADKFYLNWVDWMPLYMCDTWDAARKDMADRLAKSDPAFEMRVNEVLDWLERGYSLDSFAIVGVRR